MKAHFDYENWQMDVKTAFHNGSLDECIYMMQQDNFVAKSQEHIVCKLKKLIYGYKQASRLGTLILTRPLSLMNLISALTSHVYKKHSGNVVVFLILHVDDILLIGNDVGALSLVNVWL